MAAVSKGDRRLVAFLAEKAPITRFMGLQCSKR
jgi:hypothetical protein